MRSIYLFPYAFSPAALDLAEAIDGWLIKRKGSRYVHKPQKHFVINWGCSGNIPFPVQLNQPAAVGIATSKTRTFDCLRRSGVPVPEWTRDRALALTWAQKGKVLGRDLDNGSQGRGITVYPKGSDGIGVHRFYVRYIRKEREFRIHVFNGEVIFEQEKLKKKDEVDADKYIRSHDRGWCFAFHHLVDNPVPSTCREQAVAAVRALGLDFGAVDMAWSERSGPTVLEVNTAPGIENTSLDAYRSAILRLVEASK